MDTAFEAKLIECLDALANGDTLEAILRRYPNDAAALRPMLETAQQLSHMPVGYSVAAQRASRQAFLAKASQLRSKGRRFRLADWFRWPSLPQFAPSLAAAALVFLLISAAIFALLNDRQGGNNTLSPGEATATPGLTSESTSEPTEYPENTETVTPTPTTTAEPSATTPSPTATIQTKTATPTRTVSPSATPARPTYTPTATVSDTPTTPVITPEASETLEQETPTVDPDPEPTEEEDEEEEEDDNGGGSGGDGENEND